MPGRPEDPTLYRRRVRGTLRKAREARGLTQRQAAEALDWSMSKIVRIEAGAVGVSTTDLRALLGLYRVSDEAEVAAIVEMARASKRRPWFAKYQEVLSPAFAQYLGYESAASAIRAFEPLAVMGLLQTDDYARAILQAIAASRADERSELRAARQEIFDRADCPDMFFVLDEAALRRRVGGAGVMRGQLRHLLAVMEHPKISLQIVPFAVGAHPAMPGSFTILEFPDWDEDVLYQETAEGSITTREHQDRIAKYRAAFDQLQDISLPAEKTKELIEISIRDLNDDVDSPAAGHYVP